MLCVKRLDSFHVRFLRWILHIKWQDKLRSVTTL